jgi:predicted Zn-dependent protease
MKTPATSPGQTPVQTAVKTYLFGSFTLYRNEKRQTYALRANARRLALVTGVAFMVCYALVVSAGYLWLREARQIDEVGFLDVALLRAKKIRQELSVHQFAKAQMAVAAKDYSMAYIDMTSGLHNDPDNVAGRLQFARFWQTAGAAGRAVSLLEEGLARAPDNQDLIDATLDFLTKTGRDDQALKLLHGQLAPQYSGPNGTRLRTYEVIASLNTEGPAAARQLLDRYPDLKTTTRSLPVVASVLWATQDQLAAIDTLSAFIKAEPDNFAGYAALADYQQRVGLVSDARQTADLACARFPKEFAPRLVRIAMLAPTQPAELSRWVQEIDSYVNDFGNKPEAVVLLAEISGQKGWVDLARTLYEVGAGGQQDFRILAVYYSDALLHQGKFPEAQRVLAEIDRQTPDASRFALLLWQREIVAAAASGDPDTARESARRVASALRLDPEGLEIIRQHFIRLKIPEAVAELTGAAPEAKTIAPKKN